MHANAAQVHNLLRTRQRTQALMEKGVNGQNKAKDQGHHGTGAGHVQDPIVVRAVLVLFPRFATLSKNVGAPWTDKALAATEAQHFARANDSGVTSNAQAKESV